MSDTDAHRVLRVVNGAVEVVAGNGKRCRSPLDQCGDGGQAVRAQLNGPTGLALMPDGRLLIADTYDNRVRVVAPGGRITTFAGNGHEPSKIAPHRRANTNGRQQKGEPTEVVASQAALAFPRGIAVAPNGSVFVGHRERVSEISRHGRLSLIAGGGRFSSRTWSTVATTRRLVRPTAVRYLRDGSLLIADVGLHQVLLYRDGQLRVFAGSGVKPPKLDHERVTLLKEEGPAYQSSLGAPQDIAETSTGVLIVDTLYGLVRLVDAQGNIRTIAGCLPNFRYGREKLDFNGDKIAPIDAVLGKPEGIATTDSGFFLAESYFRLVRFVNNNETPTARPSFNDPSYFSQFLSLFCWSVTPELPTLYARASDETRAIAQIFYRFVQAPEQPQLPIDARAHVWRHILRDFKQSWYVKDRWLPLWRKIVMELAREPDVGKIKRLEPKLRLLLWQFQRVVTEPLVRANAPEVLREDHWLRLQLKAAREEDASRFAVANAPRSSVLLDVLSSSIPSIAPSNSILPNVLSSAVSPNALNTRIELESVD